MNMNLTLLMQAVAFLLFIAFCWKFIWPPLTRAIDTRQRQIAEGLQAGEQGRQSLASAQTRIEAMMNEAKQKAAEIVATGEKFRAETIEAARGEAQAEKDRILASAQAELQQEITRAKEHLRNQVADLAVAGASKILQREVDANAHADLLASIRGGL
ncbi:MAG TPA: F0F1 ATP synthase subunit B [Casimicrobiaceae bacterium]|nr:F0F1 ATP synthase subunit B [Casimicrobiaceae bacterium]